MTFKVGQKVVYPNHGVTVVEEIAPSRIDGTERTCYHLRLLSGNSKVMVPKDNLDLVGLRPLCEAKEIRTLFGILENGSVEAQKDWKGRYKQNVEKMKTGRITEVAEVLKNLRFVSSFHWAQLCIEALWLYGVAWHGPPQPAAAGPNLGFDALVLTLKGLAAGAGHG